MDDITIEKINEWLSSPDLYGLLLPFKILSFIVCVLFIYGIFYYFFRQRFLFGQAEREWKDFLNPQSAGDKESILKRWDEIRKLIAKEEQMTYKLAVIKAANLFYDVLDKSKLEEKNVEKIEAKTLKYIEQVRELLEIADDLREDPSYVIDFAKIKTFLIYLGETLDELDVI